MAEEIKTTETTATEEPKAEAATPAENPEIVKLRNALSRANSEAANWKRQYTETLDAQKQKELKEEEERKAQLEELETLRKDKRISTYKSRLMETGVDPASADIMANALPDGVSDDYFATLKSYLDNQRKAADTAALNNQPKLSVGVPPTGAQRTEEDMKLDKIFGLTH